MVTRRSPGEYPMHMDTRNVLLVSSDDATARRTTVALSKAGYDVRRAYDADRATMMILGGTFLAVVLDRKLPDDGSARVLQRLAANADLFWVPVVLIGDEPDHAWASLQRPNRAGAVLRALAPVCQARVV
jgi:DNA-binding NtrC family response regulator